MQSIDEHRDGEQIRLFSGEEFEVALAENPTTGYRWFLADPDPAILSLIDESRDGGGGAQGARGSRRWRFRAQSAGATRLAFLNRRSWEASGPRSFAVEISVAPA